VLSGLVHGILIYTYHYNEETGWHDIPLYYLAIINFTVDILILAQAFNKFRKSKRFFQLYYSLLSNKSCVLVPRGVRIWFEGLIDFLIVIGTIIAAIIVIREINKYT